MITEATIVVEDKSEYFDKISESYRDMDIEEMPVRRYCEIYTLQELLGDLTGQSVLDLGCSDGFFTRLCKQWGAARAVGVDLSPEMIALAQETEATHRLGVEYQIDDILNLRQIGQFDVVFMPFTLNFAQTRQELLSMCQNTYKNLKPKARFISMNDHPSLLPESNVAFEKYGLTKSFTPPLHDGDPVTVTIIRPDKNHNKQSVSFTAHYFSSAAFEWALQSAGFEQVQWHSTRISPEGLHKYGADFWADYLTHPSVVFIESIKA